MSRSSRLSFLHCYCGLSPVPWDGLGEDNISSSCSILGYYNPGPQSAFSEYSDLRHTSTVIIYQSGHLNYSWCFPVTFYKALGCQIITRICTHLFLKNLLSSCIQGRLWYDGQKRQEWGRLYSWFLRRSVGNEHILYLDLVYWGDPKLFFKKCTWIVWRNQRLKWLIRPYFVLNRFTKHFSNSHNVCNYQNHTSIGQPWLLHAWTTIWLSTLVRVSFCVVISHNHSLPGCMRMCKQLFTDAAHLNMNLLSEEH